jgi:pyruvate,orthophosphate dikinase
VRVGDTVLRAGDRIAIDGTTGASPTRTCPLVQPEVSEHFQRVLGWSDELRSLGVRTNADTPGGRREGARVRRRGASGCAARSTCSWPPTASP